jgi:hypothetical protein
VVRPERLIASSPDAVSFFHLALNHGGFNMACKHCGKDHSSKEHGMKGGMKEGKKDGGKK